MIFAARAWQGGAKLAIANRAAQRRDPAHNPEHQEREPGLNARQLKSETREDAGADDIRNDNGAGRDETNRARRSWRFQRMTFSDTSHDLIDNCIRVDRL